jgi:hypothetical protein
VVFSNIQGYYFTPIKEILWQQTASLTSRDLLNNIFYSDLYSLQSSHIISVYCFQVFGQINSHIQTYWSVDMKVAVLYYLSVHKKSQYNLHWITCNVCLCTVLLKVHVTVWPISFSY